MFIVNTQYETSCEYFCANQTGAAAHHFYNLLERANETIKDKLVVDSLAVWLN